MPYKDMPLICQACGSQFYFTAGEQEFYADKGFLHEPTRCPKCRSNRSSSGRSSSRDANSAPRREDRSRRNLNSKS